MQSAENEESDGETQTTAPRPPLRHSNQDYESKIIPTPSLAKSLHSRAKFLQLHSAPSVFEMTVSAVAQVPLDQEPIVTGDVHVHVRPGMRCVG